MQYKEAHNSFQVKERSATTHVHSGLNWRAAGTDRINIASLSSLKGWLYAPLQSQRTDRVHKISAQQIMLEININPKIIAIITYKPDLKLCESILPN